MTTLFQLLLLLAPLLHRVPLWEQCVADATAPALDHVVLAVRDLELASAAFEKHGFRLKRGRLHPNNLLNRHIKFRDGSEIELMTVSGPPGDAMAEDYLDLIKAGEGGVYVALEVTDISAPARAAARLQLHARQSASGPWKFLSFPPTSPAAAVFFGSGTATAQDPDSLLSHEPDVTALAEAWIEAGPATGDLLASLKASRCGPARSPDGQVGERWALSRGTIVVVPAGRSAPPRVLGVVLQSRTPPNTTLQPLGNFWVRYQR
jgi:hypothetical protein